MRRLDGAHLNINGRYQQIEERITMNLITNKHNEGAINLDNVTSIFPTPSKNPKCDHKIYFHFNAMNNDELHHELWTFNDVKDLECVMGYINALATDI